MIKEIRNVLSIFIVISYISCGSYCNREKKEEEKQSDLDFYLKRYPNAKREYDSSKKVTFLNFYSDDSIRHESLIFDDSNKILEYVFYNSLINEPRFLIIYDTLGKIKETRGDPLFAASEYFKEDKYVTDSFYVQIYLATPPNFKARLSIYQVYAPGKFIQTSTHEIKDDHVIAFMGKIDKGKPTERYCIISELISETQSDYKRADTTYFTLKAKMP